jgi:hypothetical protein
VPVPNPHEVVFRVVLGDARAAVAVGDEVGAIRQPRNVRRPIEGVRSAAAHAELSLAVYELPVVGEAVDHVQLVVDDPDVLLLVVRADLDLMRAAAARQLREHLVEMRPLVHELTVSIQDVDRVLEPPLPSALRFGFTRGGDAIAVARGVAARRIERRVRRPRLGALRER